MKLTSSVHFPRPGRRRPAPGSSAAGRLPASEGRQRVRATAWLSVRRPSRRPPPAAPAAPVTTRAPAPAVLGYAKTLADHERSTRHTEACGWHPRATRGMILSLCPQPGVRQDERPERPKLMPGHARAMAHAAASCPRRAVRPHGRHARPRVRLPPAALPPATQRGA